MAGSSKKKRNIIIVIVVVAIICVGVATGKGKTSEPKASTTPTPQENEQQNTSVDKNGGSEVTTPADFVVAFNDIRTKDNYTTIAFKNQSDIAMKADFYGSDLTVNKGMNSLVVTCDVGGGFDTMRTAFIESTQACDPSITEEAASTVFDSAYPQGIQTDGDPNSDEVGTLGSLEYGFSYANQDYAHWQIIKAIS